MRSRSQPGTEGQAKSAEDEFAEVRRSFKVRLRADQARLAALTVRLQAPRAGDTSALADLGSFAHRLRGAAAVFEYPALSAAARALELAIEQRTRGTAQVTVAAELGALAAVLASTNDGDQT